MMLFDIVLKNKKFHCWLLHLELYQKYHKYLKNQQIVLVKDAGIVDYKKGEVILNTINITSTVSENNIIEVQAFPESNDVIGLKDLYLNFDVSKSTINTLKDVIASGEDVSGVVFTRDYYTSSYSNGDLERK